MSSGLTRDKIVAFAPRPKSKGESQKNWDGYVDAMTSPEAAAMFVAAGVLTRNDLCAFMANAAQETGDNGAFTCLWENLNFKTVEAIRSAWRARASKHSDAWIRANLLSNPKAVGAWAYDGRMGNGRGNGDGYNYRGFGILQTTGKTDHMRYLNGDHSYMASLRAALSEWKDKGCSDDIAEDDFDGACIKINGGRNGLAERRRFYAAAQRVWTDAPAWGDVTPTDALKPKPKSITKAVKSSRPVSMQINGFLTAIAAAIYSWWHSIVETVSGLFSSAPTVADSVTRTIGATKQITQAVGLTLEAKALLAISATCIVVAFVELIGSARNPK